MIYLGRSMPTCQGPMKKGLLYSIPLQSHVNVFHIQYNQTISL